MGRYMGRMGGRGERSHAKEAGAPLLSVDECVGVALCRFGIQQMGEFYAATEGTFALFNTKNKPGAD